MQQINGGDVNGLVTFSGLPFVNKTVALSTVTTLPIKKGPLALAQNVTLPNSFPLSGTIGLQITATNENAAEMFCLTVSFDV